MKTTSSLTGKISFAATLIAGFSLVALPVTTYAAMATNAAEQKTSPFCTQLPTKASTITTQVNSLVGKANDAWTQQDQKLASIFQKVDQDVSADRQKADADRQTDFGKLSAKATTDSEKQAVQTYESAVQSAVSTRRAAYDAARHTYRTDLQSAISSRRGVVSGQLSTFQSSVGSALSTAEASCTSTPNEGPTIRTALQASLKSDRETFQNDRKGDDSVRTQQQQLAATRNAAFKAADQTFQTNMNAARQALQQAFGKTSV